MIYFIKINEYIKVGYSCRPFARFSSIQTSTPYDAELLGIIPGDESFEKLLHVRFRENRVRGEWFEGIANDVREILGFYEKLFPDFLPKDKIDLEFTAWDNNTEDLKIKWSGNNELKRSLILSWFNDFEERPSVDEWERDFGASRRTYYDWVPGLWRDARES